MIAAETADRVVEIARATIRASDDRTARDRRRRANRADYDERGRAIADDRAAEPVASTAGATTKSVTNYDRNAVAAPNSYDLSSTRRYDRKSTANSSIRQECLRFIIPLGERHLRKVVAEYVAHYHLERNHQGLGNRVIDPEPQPANDNGRIVRRTRLGGLLSFYHRRSA